MQKWLPEPFDDFNGPVATVAGAMLEAQSQAFQSGAPTGDTPGGDLNRLFMSEKGFQGPEAMMSHLTPEERAQVFDLVEQDIRVEYEKREKELILSHAAELENVRQAFDTALQEWTTRITEAQARHLKTTAEAAARMTLTLAEKMVRSKVAEDSSVLMRALETALFKLEGARDTTVSLNPEEAEWLQSRPEVLEKMGIANIVADRRIDKGGCMVRTERKEWDATLKGQLSYLSELVEEMISTQEDPDLNAKDDTDVDPGLD